MIIRLINFCFSVPNKTKLRELERKYELQVLQHEEVTVEMEELRKEAEIAKFRTLQQTMDTQSDRAKSTTSSPRSPRSMVEDAVSLNDSGPVLPTPVPDDRQREGLHTCLGPFIAKIGNNCD